MNHRGPDASNDWESKIENNTCWLGHTRLAILDLSINSNQPFQDQTKNWTLVFNGEIYNFLELRNYLIKKGIKFKTDSDTEVLLNGLIIEGLDFQKKCNGMWAFALWNESEQTLYLGRDRFGIKPLYWFKSQQKDFCFGSEMKAIRSFYPQITLSNNFVDLCKNPFSYESTEETIYDDIFRLKAEHNAIYKNGELKIRRWWNTLDNIEEVPSSYREQMEKWRELFFDSIHLRMRADVKIGTALSGGLDSSSIIASMSHIYKSKDMNRIPRQWQNAFSCSYPDSELNERKMGKKGIKIIGYKTSDYKC